MHALHDEIMHRGRPSYINPALGGMAKWIMDEHSGDPLSLLIITVSDVAKPAEQPFRHLQYVRYEYKISKEIQSRLERAAADFPGVSIENGVLVCWGAWAGQIQCTVYYCLLAAMNATTYADARPMLLRDIAETIDNPARGFTLESGLTQLVEQRGR